MRGRILSPSQESTSSGSCQSAEAKTRAYIGSVLLRLDTWRMDCLRRTHKERREHRAVRRRRRVHGHRGGGAPRRLSGGTTAAAAATASCPNAVRRRVPAAGAACPYAPLDNSYSYAMGVLLRMVRHLAGEIASLLLLLQPAS